jgi:hypothetical protein
MSTRNCGGNGNLVAGVGMVTALLIPYAGCGVPGPVVGEDVKAIYDPASGKLQQLVYDSNKNGKPDAWTHMEGTRVVRIELDQDENGMIERWEYYGPHRQLEKIGASSANDGTVDTWAYRGPDGGPGRIERSMHRDGRVDRIEFYEKGVVVRAEQDVDHDGRADRWETYEKGALATVAFDTKRQGTPDRWFAPGNDGALHEIARPTSTTARQ